VTIRASRDGRVTCRAAIPLALPAGSVWGQVRDFRRYASHDYFHRDVRVGGGVPRAGAPLRLTHCFACFRVERVGRILRWREGAGFAFSDLSRRGPRAGFPHVFALRIESAGDGRSTLHLSVRGRWTAGWVPLFARRIWLAWMFAYVVARTRNELRAYQAARGASRRAPRPAGTC
jgi:hypothetical protein